MKVETGKDGIDSVDRELSRERTYAGVGRRSSPEFAENFSSFRFYIL